MTEFKKEELLKEIEELNQTVDYPELFLKNFFKDLRDDIDKEVETKKKNLQKKDKNCTKLNEIRKEMIIQIDLFEKQCFRTKFRLGANKQKINEIKALLDNQNTLELSQVKEAIIKEEYDLWQILFLNKTIFFVSVKNFMPKSFREHLIDFRLVILNDEFLSPKVTKEK